jgi:outer membrane biogenesis lipoprotein LolB
VNKTRIVLARLVSLALLLVLFTGLEGCATRPSPETVHGAQKEKVSATYKGRYRSENGDHGRFRAWVWAVPPDRLHVEIYGPMGGTRLVLDGGGGNLVALLPRDRIAYAGESGERDLSPLVGVRLTLPELVAAITGAVRPAGLEIWIREPPDSAGLPARLEVGVDGTVLELVMQRLRPLPAGAEDQLGRGVVPPNWEVRPLAELLPEIAK